MAETTYEATKLLVISPLLKTQSCKVQLTMEFLRFLWRLVNAILNTGAGPNMIRKAAIPQSYWHEIGEMKSKLLRSAADTTLEVIISITFLIQLEQQVTRTGFW